MMGILRSAPAILVCRKGAGPGWVIRAYSQCCATVGDLSQRTLACVLSSPYTKRETDESSENMDNRGLDS